MDSGRAGARPAVGDTSGGDGDTAGDAGAPNVTPPIRIGPNGQVETEAQYEARIAHNSCMRFSRSLNEHCLHIICVCDFCVPIVFAVAQLLCLVWSTEARIVPSQSLMQLLAKGIVTWL